MDLQTHLSFRERFGIRIQIINMWSESLEVWDDKLLSEGLSEQDNVVLNAPDEQTTNNMATLLWLHVDEEGKVCQSGAKLRSLTNFNEVTDEAFS